MPADSLKVDSLALSKECLISHHRIPHRSYGVFTFLASSINYPGCLWQGIFLMPGGSDSSDYAIHYHQHPGSGGIRDPPQKYPSPNLVKGNFSHVPFDITGT